MAKQWQGPTRATIWRLRQRDGTLTAVWDGLKLTSVVCLAKKLEHPLEVVADIESFLLKQPAWARVVSDGSA